MTAQKYIYKDEQQLGPFNDDYIVFSLQNGKFSFEDLCWEEGWENWRQLSSVFQPPPPPKIVKLPPAPSLQRQKIPAIESRETIPREDDTFTSLLSSKIKENRWLLIVFSPLILTTIFQGVLLPGILVDRSLFGNTLNWDQGETGNLELGIKSIFHIQTIVVDIIFWSIVIPIFIKFRLYRFILKK